MRDERGNIAGAVTIKEPYTLWGSIAGKVTVVDGSKFYMRGAIYGDMDVQDGGRVHVLGNISGSIYVHEGAKVVMGGNVGGDCHNLGGRLYIEATGSVLGKVKGYQGETRIESGAKATRD